MLSKTQTLCTVLETGLNMAIQVGEAREGEPFVLKI
jgi:hypothetical protein